MKCSDCHEMVRPVVLFDIDGTLADYHSHLMNFCIDYYDLPMSKGECKWEGDGDFEDFLGLTREEYREAKLSFRQGGMKRTMPIQHFARTAVEKVRQAGAEIWMTTTRPWQRLDNVDPDTREWLRRHGIRYDGLMYDEFKYSRILDVVEHPRIVAVLDDLPDMYDHAVDNDLPVTLIKRTHNIATPRLSEATLPDATKWAVANVQEWYKKNG